MKVFLVVTIARQILGDYIAVRTEKGFLTASKADDYLKELKKTLVDQNGNPNVILVNTPHGEIKCHGEAGAFDIEVEE